MPITEEQLENVYARFENECVEEAHKWPVRSRFDLARVCDTLNREFDDTPYDATDYYHQLQGWATSIVNDLALCDAFAEAGVRTSAEILRVYYRHLPD